MKERIGKLPLYALVAFLCCAAPACHSSGGGGSSTSTGTVQGIIRDLTTNLPIAGAVVTDGTTTVVTDANGAYSIGKSPDMYSLTVKAPGYVASSRLCPDLSPTTTTMNWLLTASPGSYVNYGDPASAGRQIPAASMDYVVLAWNDLGMHCAQDDYSYFLILPPYNTLHVQVLRRGGGIVTAGITVTYGFPKKTDSTLHTNFWTYASKYGFTLQPNVGLTGSKLTGTMDLDAKGLGFVATGIPVTPYDDDGTWDPYGFAVITVTDSATGAVLQTAQVVVPISTELDCNNCHGPNAFQDILQAHDKFNGTQLATDQAGGVLHLCAECHADNALNLPGKTGISNFSLAMHNFHKDKIPAGQEGGSAACYNCHPGPNTQCLRGQMFHAGIVCQDCHGDLNGMAAKLQAGRKPWLEEPKCGDCHSPQYAENAGTLYRDSVFMNAAEEMNGKLYCEACHNSTHAEFASTNAVDNVIPQKFQGDSYWIWNCYVCHTDYMPSPSMHSMGGAGELHEGGGEMGESGD